MRTIKSCFFVQIIEAAADDFTVLLLKMPFSFRRRRSLVLLLLQDTIFFRFLGQGDPSIYISENKSAASKP